MATPGRLEDFLQRNFNGLNMSACTKSLVIIFFTLTFVHAVLVISYILP